AHEQRSRRGSRRRCRIGAGLSGRIDHQHRSLDAPRAPLTRDMRSAIAVVLAVTIVAARVQAQQVASPSALTPGTRVRVAYRELAAEALTGAPKPVTGELVAIRGDSIDVLPDESSRVARFLTRNLDHIDYSRGEYHPIVRSALIGTGLGIAFGYLAG